MFFIQMKGAKVMGSLKLFKVLFTTGVFQSLVTGKHCGAVQLTMKNIYFVNEKTKRSFRTVLEGSYFFVEC